MAREHVAPQRSLNVTPEGNATSKSLTDGGTDNRSTLGSLTGPAFDKAYIDNEVTYHQSVLDAIDQTLIPNAQNADLKALLQEVRPNIAAHLTMAKEPQTTLTKM